MPIQDGKYVAPTWVNNAPPPPPPTEFIGATSYM